MTISNGNRACAAADSFIEITSNPFVILQISRLESEFSAYKVRAHALLQKKDAELTAAKSSDFIKEHEEAIRVMPFFYLDI